MFSGFRVSVVVAVVSWSAFAEPIPVTLMWSAPPECPQQEIVWAQLSERMGRVPSTPNRSAFAARGEVLKTETGWRVELQTLSASGAGTRVLTHAQCDQLTRMAVVALSVAIDPGLEPPPEPTTKSFWLGLGAAGSVGALSFPTPGVAATATFDLLPASFEFSLLTSLPQRYERSDGRALQLGLPFGATLSGCLGLHGTRLSGLACATVAASLVTAEATGVQNPVAGLAPLVSLGPRLEGRVLVHDRVRLRLALDASLAASRPAFVFANSEPAFSSSLLGFAALLGVEFRIQ